MTREEQIRKAADDYCGDDTREQSPCFYAHIHNAFLEGVAWADSHPHWIPVEEELPKCNIVDCGLATYPVLVYREDGFRDISCYDSEVGEWDCVGVVTHWMPLSQPPRKEANNKR